jgi:hypothetical protein
MGEPAGLAQEQLRILARLKAVGELDQFYLAGGTAIAFHLAHLEACQLMRLCASLSSIRRRPDPSP